MPIQDPSQRRVGGVSKLVDEKQAARRFDGEVSSFTDYEEKNRAVLHELDHSPSLELKELEARLKNENLRWELLLGNCFLRPGS